MNCIKIKYSFMAVKKNFDGEYQTVLYCEHCHKMDLYYKYFVTKKEELNTGNTEFINFLINDEPEDLNQLNNSSMSCPSIQVLYMKSHGFDIETKGKKALLICPSCKKEIKNTMFLYSSVNWMYRNSIPYKYELEQDGDKKILNTFSYSIFPVTKVGKLKYLNINCRFVFNERTKQIYAMQAYDADNKKPLFKEQKRIINITHYSNSSNFLNNIQTQILNDKKICKYLIKELGLTLYENNHQFMDIAIAFRYKNVGEDARKIIGVLCSYKYIDKATAQKRKRILHQVFLVSEGVGNRDSSSFFDEISKKKCPDKKKFRKMCLDNPFVLYMYSLFRRLGMRNYDLIMDIISVKSMQTWYVELYTDIKHRSYETKVFLKAYIKHRGEHALKSEIVSYYKEKEEKRLRLFFSSIIEDCVALYFSIGLIGSDKYYNDANSKESELNKENLGLITWDSIEKMHDDMPHLLRRLKTKNQKITYQEDDFKLNGEYNGILFSLAPDTHSLLDCGDEMGICVGGYGMLALRRGCVIVFMTIPNTNKFVGCIELSPDIKTLMQAKAKFNKQILGEEAEALRQWVESNSISTDRCKDYSHIKGKSNREEEKTDEFEIRLPQAMQMVF